MTIIAMIFRSGLPSHELSSVTGLHYLKRWVFAHAKESKQLIVHILTLDFVRICFKQSEERYNAGFVSVKRCVSVIMRSPLPV